MSAAWPVVVDRLVSQLPSLPGWSGIKVYDGPVVTGATPTDFVTVGYVDGEDFGGSYEQTRNGEGGYEGCLEESGTVRSEIVCQTGGDKVPAMRARAFALVDAWEAWVSSDETLGVLGPLTASSLAVDVQPIQNTAGSAQRLTVTLTYLTHS